MMAEVVVQRLLRAAACFRLWMEEAKAGGDSKAVDAWDEEDVRGIAAADSGDGLPFSPKERVER